MSNVIQAVVITVSDSAASGRRQDESGPAACRLLRQAGYVVDDPVVVPDSRPFIAARIREAAATAQVVITTGGTGLAPRDVTPEGTRDAIDREVPGIAEMLRAEGRRGTPTACLSRGVAGLVGRCLVVNLPGSPAAVKQGLEALLPVLGHALRIAAGDTEHR